MMDLNADVIENATVRLHDLFYANFDKTGLMYLTGRTFRNCRLDGPVVMMPMQNCYFERCDFGDSGGDMHNMLFRPLSPTQVTGAIVMVACRFINCTFYAVGFAGDEDFAKSMIDIPYRDEPA